MIEQGNKLADSNETMQQVMLRSVADQLKQPLLRIARSAELYSGGDRDAPSSLLPQMQLQAETALKLVDSYILGLEAYDTQAELPLESFSLSSSLYDVSQELFPLAKACGVELELSLSGKYGPIMGHSAALKAALYSLGASLVELPSQVSNNGSHIVLQLAAHRTPRGIVTGWYHSGLDKPLSTRSNMRNILLSRQRQPFQQILPKSSAGIFVADNLFSSMNTRLRPSIFRGNHGFAATLSPSKQLALL